MIAVFLLFSRSLNEIMTYPEPFEELKGCVSVPGLGFENHAETVIIM